MTKTEDHDIYETIALKQIGNHKDRKLFPNFNHLSSTKAGDVHINLLMPKAIAGHHYHETTFEFFINPGPGSLLLHLQNPKDSRQETIEMQPASIKGLKAYRAKRGIAHAVENPHDHPISLIILVDKDNPDDKCEFKLTWI